MKKVWALFKIEESYSSNSSNMLACFDEKPSVDKLIGEGFSEEESHRLLEDQLAGDERTSYYLEEIDDYEDDD